MERRKGKCSVCSYLLEFQEKHLKKKPITKKTNSQKRRKKKMELIFSWILFLWVVSGEPTLGCSVGRQKRQLNETEYWIADYIDVFSFAQSSLNPWLFMIIEQ